MRTSLGGINNNNNLLGTEHFPNDLMNRSITSPFGDGNTTFGHDFDNNERYANSLFKTL